MSGVVPYVDFNTTLLKNGEWYAFELAGRKFFAVVNNNSFTGFLELTEIPDPYICEICGKGYQEGAHWDGGHEYKKRGYAADVSRTETTK